MTSTAATGPVLVLTQGFAGDRLGARLIPAFRRALPDRELLGIGGDRMAAQGARLVARTDRISAIGYSGVLPEVPAILAAILRTRTATRHRLPACVVAIDVWQPLRYLHRFAAHLKEVPHICYLPPGPNFIGVSRVHGAASRVFRAIVTPFPHQARLFAAAGARVELAGHAGLEVCREETSPLPADRRENVLALLPGSRALEVRYGLPVHVEAARGIVERHPELTPVVCCASDEVARLVKRRCPGLATTRETRATLARARFAIICSGTAALEASILGCPGIVTYHVSPLQRWEWKTFHVAALARLRAAGTASPYIAMPNIIAGAELYPERLGAPAEEIAAAALEGLSGDLVGKRALLDEVAQTLSWKDSGTVIAGLVEEIVRPGEAS